MDLDLVRNAVTLVSLLLFVGLVAWTWRPARRRAHDAAARLPFDGDGEGVAEPHRRSRS